MLEILEGHAFFGGYGWFGVDYNYGQYDHSVGVALHDFGLNDPHQVGFANWDWFRKPLEKRGPFPEMLWFTREFIDYCSRYTYELCPADKPVTVGHLNWSTTLEDCNDCKEQKKECLHLREFISCEFEGRKYIWELITQENPCEEHMLGVWRD
jgi:hypothetical protein